MNDSQMIIIEKFIKELSNQIVELERMVKFLNLPDSTKVGLNKAIKILKKKRKKILKASSKKDLKKVLKLKEIAKLFERGVYGQ